MKMSFRISREVLYQVLLVLVMIFMTTGYNFSSFSIAALTIFYVADKHIGSKIKSVNLKFYLPFLCYFGLLLIGMIYSSNIDKAIKLTTTSVSFLLLPLILLTESISKSNLDRLLMIYKYWLIVLAFYLMIHKVFIQGGPLWTMTLFTLKTQIGIHQLYFSQFYYVGLLMSAYEIIKGDKKTILTFLETGFFIFFLVLLGSATAIIITILTLVFLGYYYVSKKRVATKILFILSLILVGFLASQTQIIKSKIQKNSTIDWDIERSIEKHKELKEGFGKVNTLNLRFIKWYAAKEILKDHYWVGVGTGDAQDQLVSQYEKIQFANGIQSKYNAHNQYIETFLKFGVFGIISILWLVFSPLMKAIESRNYFLFFVTFFLAISFLLESMLERQHGIVFMCFFIPLFHVFNREK